MKAAEKFNMQTDLEQLGGYCELLMQRFPGDYKTQSEKLLKTGKGIIKRINSLCVGDTISVDNKKKFVVYVNKFGIDFVDFEFNSGGFCLGKVHLYHDTPGIKNNHISLIRLVWADNFEKRNSLTKDINQQFKLKDYHKLKEDLVIINSDCNHKVQYNTRNVLDEKISNIPFLSLL